jgi:murein DD-endopeptidase MepM/ murein hydrolase activator NlpD
MRRLLTAAVIASVLWIPLSMKSSVAGVYCYPGDPPAVYQACVAYNQGIGAQVTSETQMVAVLHNISSAEGQINAISGIIKNLDAQIKAQQALIDKTQLAIDEVDRQIRFTQASVTRLHASISVRDALLNQRLRYVDDHGSVNYVEVVLSANTFNDLMNRMIGAQQVAASDRRLLDQLGQDRAAFDQTNANLTIQRGQVAALLQQLQATKADLQKNQATEKAALAQEQLLEAKLNDQYRQLGEERKAIDAQVAALQLQYDAAARKAGGGNGAFEWPVQACGFACITQGFGPSSFYLEPPYGGYAHFHTGIDIAGPYGTPIYAADTGVVSLYVANWGYGIHIIMTHGNGYSTYYGHMAGFAPGLRSGDIVGRGEVIGYEGSTGWSTGPHLHFEIRVNDVPKDPCIWLGC